MAKTFAIACITVAGLVAGPATAHAAPEETLCGFTYPTPDDFSVTAGSKVTATPGAAGVVDLRIYTDAASEAGYDQRFGVTWANLDTGRSGVAEENARVQGPETVLTIPGVTTEPGRIAFVLSASNHGSDQNYTYGDCSAEYVVP